MAITNHVHLILPQRCHLLVSGYVLHRSPVGCSIGHVTPDTLAVILMVILTLFY